MRRTLEIIDYLQPDFYFTENPSSRAPYGLHSRPCMKGLPTPHLATYCRYGTAYRKPTHIWTNAPLSEPLRQCNADSPCEHKRDHGCHAEVAQGGSAYRASGKIIPGKGSCENLYGIPASLLEHLFRDLPFHFSSSVCLFMADLLLRELSEDCEEDSDGHLDLDPVALSGAKALPIEVDGGWESDASCLSD